MAVFPSYAPSLASRTSKIITATTFILLSGLFAHYTDMIGRLQVDKTSFPHYYLAQTAKSSTRPFLDYDIAQETCSRRRLNVYPERNESRKVYDLFIINTELDMLEIRLGELHEHVDYFVVVESKTTFVGNAKPLYLKENWERFQPYHSQIIYREIDLTGLEFEDSWARERFHRDATYNQVIPYLQGEQKANDDDVLIMSDLDEIPQPSTVEVLRNCAIPARVTLHSELHYYSFQWKRRSGGWIRLRATIYAGDSTILPDDLRMSPADIELMHSAWHCSSCLPTLDDTVNKIKSFSHDKFNTPENVDRARILRRVRSGHDLFDRRKLIYDRVDNNRNIPGFLLKPENLMKFAYLVDRDPPSGNFRDFREEDLVLYGNVSWIPPSAIIPAPS